MRNLPSPRPNRPHCLSKPCLSVTTTQTLSSLTPLSNPKPLIPPMDGHDSISDQPLISPPSPPSKPQPRPEPEPELESIEPPTNNTDIIMEPGEKRKQTEPDSEPVAPLPDKSKHPMWKTSLCSYFRRTGGECSHGDTCRYAHSEEELRQRPDNTWDPTSERGKKMKNENGEGVEVKRGGDEVLITEAIGDCCSDDVLQKCLVNLPMRWGSDNLRSFLADNVSNKFIFIAYELMYVYTS